MCGRRWKCFIYSLPHHERSERGAAICRPTQRVGTSGSSGRRGWGGGIVVLNVTQWAPDRLSCRSSLACPLLRNRCKTGSAATTAAAAGENTTAAKWMVFVARGAIIHGSSPLSAIFAQRAGGTSGGARARHPFLSISYAFNSILFFIRPHLSSPHLSLQCPIVILCLSDWRAVLLSLLLPCLTPSASIAGFEIYSRLVCESPSPETAGL